MNCKKNKIGIAALIFFFFFFFCLMKVGSTGWRRDKNPLMGGHSYPQYATTEMVKDPAKHGNPPQKMTEQAWHKNQMH